MHAARRSSYPAGVLTSAFAVPRALPATQATLDASLTVSPSDESVVLSIPLFTIFVGDTKTYSCAEVGAVQSSTG